MGLVFAFANISIFAQKKNKEKRKEYPYLYMDAFQIGNFHCIILLGFPHELAAQSRKETAQLCSAFEMKASYSIIIFG